MRRKTNENLYVCPSLNPRTLTLRHTAHTHSLAPVDRNECVANSIWSSHSLHTNWEINGFSLAVRLHARRLQFRKANGMNVFHFVIFVHDNSSHLFIFEFRLFHPFARIRFPLKWLYTCHVCDEWDLYGEWSGASFRMSPGEICSGMRTVNCCWIIWLKLNPESKRNGYCCFNQKQFRLFHFLELCVCNAISAIWQMPMNNYIFFCFLFVVVCYVECVCVHSLEFICKSIRFLWAMETSQSTSNNYVICLGFSVCLCVPESMYRVLLCPIWHVKIAFFKWAIRIYRFCHYRHRRRRHHVSTEIY